MADVYDEGLSGASDDVLWKLYTHRLDDDETTT